MATYTVTHGFYADGYAAIQTLTPMQVEVGDTVVISSVGTKFNGTHVVYSVQPFQYTGTDSEGYLTFDNQVPKQNQIVVKHAGHTNDDAYTALTGTVALTESCTWIVDADVVAWLGVASATANDTAFITTATNAANAWCFRKREEAGYTDALATAPSADVKLGAIMYAGTLYRERGSVDSFASFDSFGGGTATVPSATMGRIMQLLGCNRSQVA